MDLTAYYWDVQAKDTYYDLTFDVMITQPTVQLTFFGENLQDASDESWAIDNVSFQPVPEPATMLVLSAGVAMLARRRKAR